MDDHRPLNTVRRKMTGSAMEGANLSPLPDATAVAWGNLEALAELLRTYRADPAVIAIIDSALEQLEKTQGVVPASGWA
jgi:hypothetical protein